MDSARLSALFMGKLSKGTCRTVKQIKVQEDVPKLRGELKRQIQGGIRRSRKSMNTFPWMKKMSGTLMEREFARRVQADHQINE